MQVIDSSQVNQQMLAALQPVTLQDGKLVAMAPLAGSDNTLQAISLAQLTHSAAQQNSTVSSLLFTSLYTLLVSCVVNSICAVKPMVGVYCRQCLYMTELFMTALVH